MREMKVRKARLSDVAEMHRLVNFYADRSEMLHRPLSELYEDLRDFFVVEADGAVVGCGALHINWADLAEIRSLAVAEEWKGRKVGALVVKACLSEARELGIDTVFALTYQPGFFQKVGFTATDVNEMPRKVWGECFKCPKFPHCDEKAVVYRFGAPTHDLQDLAIGGGK